MQALPISERNMMYTNNNINEHNDEDGEMITSKDEEGSLLFIFNTRYKSIPINSDLASVLTIEFIQHIIFMRKQIPCTYLDLITHAETERKRREQQQKGHRLTANFQKKALRFVDDIEFAFNSIKQHFMKTNTTKFLILFGSSVQNPKEGFMLDFLNSTGNIPYEYTNKQRGQAMRKLIRTIFQNGSNIIFQTELNRPWNIFLLCYGKRLIDNDYDNRSNDNNNDINIDHNSIIAEDDDDNTSFVPIENFRLKKPRSKRGKAIFHITLNGLDYQEMEKNDDGNYDCEMTKDDNNSSDNNNHNINNKDFVWYKFAKRIKGLKNPPVERKKQKKKKQNDVFC